MTGPCIWPISYAACTECTPLTGMSAPDQAMVEAMSVEYLWNWTLKAFGVCSVVVRPCRTDCGTGRPPAFWGNGPYGSGSPSGTGPFPNPQLVGGEWTNVSCGFCRDQCSCTGSSLITLKLPGPIVAITQILIDGAILDPAAYRVDNRSLLVRLDGTPWPYCQDMSLPTTAAGTFSVAYQRGREVPAGGQIAAGLLACELAKALCRDSGCALPQRVQTITRQGVTMAMIDQGQGIEKGQTGIWAIDSWVSSITQPTRPSSVLSPDVVRPKWRIPTPSLPVMPEILIPPGSIAWLELHAGGDLDALIVGTIIRDANGAALSANVVWPDGTSGIYTATVVSLTFPGAVDAYTVTYAGVPPRTVTQPAVTRDTVTGAVTVRPAMVVT